MIRIEQYIKSLILPVIFFITGFCFTQNIDYFEIKNRINQTKYDSAYILLKKLKSKISTVYDRGMYYYYEGYIFKRQDYHDLAYQSFKVAEKQFLSTDSIVNIADVYYEIYDLTTHQKNLRTKIDSRSYLKKYINYAKKTKIPLYIARGYVKVGDTCLQSDYKKGALKNYNNAIKELKNDNDTTRIAIVKINIATVYNKISKQADSALYYLKEILPALEMINNQHLLFVNYNNQGEAYKGLEKYKEALKYYKKAETINLKTYDKKTRKIFYKNISEVYNKIGDIKNAYNYLDKYVVVSDSINDLEQNKAIIDAENKYNTLEKEKQRIINRNIAIVLGGSLVLGSIIAFLLFKNTRKKQKLAEQEKELETQKLATALKEQELISIDAMIEGQEKERQSIANDLHDDLGGLMATVKLHFNAFKEKQTLEFFDKTDTLLDEAYQKVRSIAHAKNSGVIAKQGLLKAIQNIADKVSTSNKIKIEVIDHGLEDRLENSLELTIFRIVQELVTNIIKHAEATETTIHLTNHDESLNIMVEDNGKGFNPSQITTKSKGMGISSIDKRIEHLNGSMTIESELSKGTTIIIDIPI